MENQPENEAPNPARSTRVRERMPRGGGYAAAAPEEVTIKKPQAIETEGLRQMKALANEYYSVVDKEAVMDYVAAHSAVVPFLQEARGNLARIWGSNVKVNLEVARDPEGSEYDSLMAYIQTTDDANTSIAKLSAFGTQWWNERRKLVRNQLDFDVEIHDAL